MVPLCPTRVGWRQEEPINLQHQGDLCGQVRFKNAQTVSGHSREILKIIWFDLLFLPASKMRIRNNVMGEDSTMILL